MANEEEEEEGVNTDSSTSRLADDWLTSGWLAGWLAGQTTFRLAGRLTGLLAEWLAGWLADAWLAGWLAGCADGPHVGSIVVEELEHMRRTSSTGCRVPP